MAKAQKNRTISLSRVRNVSHLKDIAESANNPVNFYVKFIVDGRDEAFCYQVDESDWETVSNTFYECKDAVSSFITFNDIEHDTLVHVNRDLVLLFQALFDAGRTEPKPISEADKNRVTIYMQGMAKPIEIAYMDETDIGELNRDLEFFDRESFEFVNFVDGDGEENSIRADRVMIVEAPDYPSEHDDENEPHR